MDFNHMAPHKNPHVHIVEYTAKKNTKVEQFNSRIYPIDIERSKTMEKEKFSLIQELTNEYYVDNINEAEIDEYEI